MAQTAGSRVEAAADVPQLFRQHYLSLVRLALHLVDDQDSAEDVVQDVFVALQSSGRSVGLDDPRRYLQTAVVNRSRSMLRRRTVARVLVATYASPDGRARGRADTAS